MRRDINCLLCALHLSTSSRAAILAHNAQRLNGFRCRDQPGAHMAMLGGISREGQLTPEKSPSIGCYGVSAAGRTSGSGSLTDVTIQICPGPSRMGWFWTPEIGSPASARATPRRTRSAILARSNSAMATAATSKRPECPRQLRAGRLLRERPLITPAHSQRHARALRSPVVRIPAAR